MKPHIKVIQRNGVDIFVTSSLVMKITKSMKEANRATYNALMNANSCRYTGGSGQLGSGVLQNSLQNAFQIVETPTIFNYPIKSPN